jgi:glycosyltransferase involved in cell wall biosynthesis
LKVVHLNSSDGGGGASIACKRISDALKLNGVDSEILVQAKKGSEHDVFSTVNDPFSKLAYLFRIFQDESYIRLFTIQKRGRFSNPSFGTDVSSHPQIQNADIINLHWINGGFLSLQSLNQLKKLGKPIVWTLHDMWAFTGGCHYNLGCEKFLAACGNCPSLNFSRDADLSSKIFEDKRITFKEFNITVVTCSKWLADEAKRSELLKDKRIENIPNPVDIEVYKTKGKNESRKILKLPSDKFLILFGSMNTKDERKGLKCLLDSLSHLAKKNNDLISKIELIVFGSFDKNLIERIPFAVHNLGRFNNESEIVACYNAADIFVAPSLQDNLPNTILESIACGTPVVGFTVGGIPDMIDHKKNGYLAELKSIDDLSNGILWFYNNRDVAKEISDNAREIAVKKFNPQLVGEKYKKLYQSLI